MDEEFMKVDEYEPTIAEIRLLEVLCNPEHKLKSILDKCKLAETSHTTYYKAMKKEGFKKLLKTTALELVVASLTSLVSATVEFGMKYKECSADRKVLLQMAGMIIEKTEHSGEIKLPNITITK